MARTSNRPNSLAEQNGIPPAQRKLTSTTRNTAGPNARNRRVKLRSALKKSVKAATDGDSLESDSDSDANQASDDSDEADEEPSVDAPSETVRKKRGHQTGLSISLSKTKINANTAKKRTWSNRVREDEGLARPTKLSKPARSTSTKVSDDDYAGVDLISESDDEDALEKAEELAIVQSQERRRRRSSSIDSVSEAEDDVNDGVIDDGGFFAEHIARTHPYNSNALFSPTSSSFDEKLSAPKTQERRVRFADDVAASSTSATIMNAGQDLFPDSFIQQDELNPSFRRQLEKSPDGEDFLFNLPLEGSRRQEPEVLQLVDHNPLESEGSLSGYESMLAYAATVLCG